MPYDSVKKFEKVIAEYAGAKYAVAVSSCTNAIFLCMQLLKNDYEYAELPCRTYPGVAASIKHAGMKIHWKKERWNGAYMIFPTQVVDSALHFRRDMYLPGTLYCLSFHVKKHLPIGRGGMILTDDKEYAHDLKKMRYDGRGECDLREDSIKLLGYNMYLTPEQASRGLQLFDHIKDWELEDLDDYETYPDLSKWKVFK